MTLEVLSTSLGAVLAIMLGTWALSRPLHNVSIVDIVWGLAFVAIAWTSHLVGVRSNRGLVMAVLITIWGLRLAGYLLWRNGFRQEDYRYAAMRRRQGDRFATRSLVTVFLVQGLLAWTVALAVMLANTTERPEDLGLLGILGSGIWLIGLVFESIGDLQLARFKRDTANTGKVMDKGLWRYTRHPNYFGDFCVWWGLFLIAAETTPGRFGFIGPIVMSTLLLRVSGVPLLERSLVKRRPGYEEYIARTSGFFPRPPRRHIP